MTVLTSAPRITSILFQGLNNLSLPFASFNLNDNVATALTGAGAYIVKSIDGLGPPDQDVIIARTASGGKYQGKSSADREIVVLIALEPDWDAGETPKLLRDNLYTMLSTGYNPKVKISLMSGLTIVGSVATYVTKFETSLFDKDPVVQITFTALNPTFSAPHKKYYAPADLDEKHPNIYNKGTSETGFQFGVKFTDTRDGWFIKQAENQNVGMVFDMTFNANDVLTVSTIPGQRYVHWKKHHGKVLNMMGILTNSSEWIMLHPGANRFVMPNGAKWQWKGRLTFTPQYWGA